MIRQIHIHDCATYSHEGVTWEDLSQVNFLYGNNGTGKSTISNMIRAISRGENVETCEVVWEESTPLDCFVYNKAFVDENFTSENIPGVFTLGADNIELQRQIAEKNAECRTQRQEFDKQLRSIDKVEKDFQDKTGMFCSTVWSQGFKLYEKDFSQAFIGYTRDKVKFANRLLEVYETLIEGEELDYVKIKQKYDQIYAVNSFVKPSINIPIDTISPLHANSILKKIIVGNQDVEVSALIKRLNNADWVHQGVHYLQMDNETCPFCQQQTITNSFRRQIESFFDESYVQNINELKSFRAAYQNAIHQYMENLREVIAFVKENQLPEFDEGVYESLLDAVSVILNENLNKVDSKLQSPSLIIELQNITEIHGKILDVISKCNEAIAQDNAIVSNLENEKRTIISTVWKYVAFSQKSTIDGYKRDKLGANKGKERLLGKKNEINTIIETLQKEIDELQESVTSVLPTVGEINRQLAFYGFTNFSIVATEDGLHYQIKREDGSIALNTLSEGEKTFITFLYFMQLIKGNYVRERALSDRVIVIDDPISSLDSNVLFLVSSLLKEEIKKIRKDKEYFIKQLLILTHNVYFFKETSFIDGRTQEVEELRYWILRKAANVTSIQAYGTKNPIKNSYEMLWDEYKQSAGQNGVAVQNVIRRIIEHYFKTLGRYKDEEILEKFEDPTEREICRSLMCWINDGSHCLSDDLFVEQGDDIIQRYKQVFRKIFEKLNHLSHYNMMMGIEEV